MSINIKQVEEIKPCPLANRTKLKEGAGHAFQPPCAFPNYP
jgi:hypothetical protein